MSGRYPKGSTKKELLPNLKVQAQPPTVAALAEKEKQEREKGKGKEEGKGKSNRESYSNINRSKR